LINIQLASPPDRERLCASLVVGNSEVAEIRAEGGGFVAEFYADPEGKPWGLPVKDLADALQAATSRLADKLGMPDPFAVK
jgi:hypothetical protein